MKISERAAHVALNKFGTLNLTDEQAIASLGIAIDEWQSSVEERLSSILPGLFGAPAVQLAPRMPRIPPTLVDIHGRTDPAAEAERARVNTDIDAHNAARFFDPGPSKYDREPFEEEA